MAAIKNDFLPVSRYNAIPFIGNMKQVAENHREDLDFLTGLLEKHNLPLNVYVKLMHIHSHQEEGNIVAWSELDSPSVGKIPFLAPMTSPKETEVRGCHYFVDEKGDLQAFEYTTNMCSLDVAAYPAFVAEFCAYIVKHDLQAKFGLGIKSGASEHGKWTEVGYPEKRATFLLRGDFELPKMEELTVEITQTQFHSASAKIKHTLDHSHGHSEYSRKNGQEEVDGVTTEGGFALGGQPLFPGTDFYRVVSAIAAA